MTKRLIALTLVICMSLSIISFADIPGTNEAVPEVYAYDFYFKDANGGVLKTNASGDITAEGYVYLTDDTVSELDVTLSIFVYYKNKIIAAEKTDARITETATLLKTPKVTVDSGIVQDITVKAMLTTKDFKTLLVPVAKLGSSSSDVAKIKAGDYEIIPEEGVYEYSITRYFKQEEIQPSVRVYTTDLSAEKVITSTKDGEVYKYTVNTTSCDGTTSTEYKINVTPVIADDTSLAGIEIDGKTIKGFAPDKLEYTLAALDGKVPTVTPYKFNSDASVTVTDATVVPGTTEIKVSYNNTDKTYKINFVKPTTVTLEADTSNASYKYAYQYRKNSSSVSAGLAASLQLKTGAADYSVDADRVGYAAFDTAALGDVDIIYPINIKTTQKYTYYAAVSVYNSNYDNSEGITDNFAEITEGTAKLLGTFMATSTQNTVAVNKGDVKICDNGNIVLLFTKKFGGHPQEDTAKQINLTSAVLEVTYLPKNLSELNDNGFDTALINKPVKPETVKGDASVTAGSGWNDINGFTLLKIDLDATFPDGAENKNVLVKVLKPGINETDDKTLTEKYAYIYETSTDGEGVINESFNLSCDAGTYTIVLSANGYEKSISTTLAMPSADKMNELLDGLKAGSYDKDTLTEYLTANLNGLSLENSLFASFGGATKKEVSQYVIDNITNTTAGGFSDTLNEGSILLGINENESDETVLKILETDEINGLLKSEENYGDYQSADKNVLIPLLKSEIYTGNNDICSTVYKKLFILKLKTCTENYQVTDVINSYRNYMTPECYLKYKGISDDEKENVNIKILEKLSEIDTISKLEEIIIANLPEKIAITEPSRTIHTYGFNFKNESGSEIKAIGNASKVKAEVYAEISDPKASNINVKFVALAYNNDKLLASSVKPYTLTKDAALITTDFVNIDANVTDVKAIIISEDEKEMLSTIGTLGSDNAKIDAIYIGNYKLPLTDGQAEYSLTRYFDENDTVKVRAYAKDFSAKVTISEAQNDGIITYTVKSTSSDTLNSEEYKINLKAYSVSSASLVGIELDGKMVEGFSPDVYEYYIGLKGNYIPETTVYKFSDKAQATVTYATEIPGTTTITVDNAGKSTTYKINFIPVNSKTLSYADYVCRAGNSSNKEEFTVRASSEPMAGGSSKVLYYLFDTSALGDISLRDVKITGTALTDIKLYFYNSSYSTIDEVCMSSESNFKEIYDGLVTYLGESKFGKGETVTVALNSSEIEIKNNKIMILVRKKYGDTNDTDYATYTGVNLNLEYIVKPAVNTIVYELSDKGFDISLLDKGNITYLSEEKPTISVDTRWMGQGAPELNLSVDASFGKESANNKALVKVLKPNVSEEDDKTLTEKYTYIGTYSLDENGNLKTEITVDEVKGDYKIIIKCENSEKSLSGTFTVPESDKITTLLNNLQSGNYTKDTLYDYLITNKAELSLNNSNLNLLGAVSGKSVCDYIIANLTDFTADGFNSMLSEALVVRGINNLESNSNVEKLLTEESIYASLKADKNYKDYTSLSDNTVFLNKLKAESFANISDVEEAFYDNLLIVKINSISSYTSVEGLIDSYSDYITPSVYASYDGLTYDERTAVNKKIADNKSLMTDISVLEAKIGDFIDNPNGVLPPVVIIPPQTTTGSGGSANLGSVTTEAPEITAPAEMSFIDVPESFWGYSYIKNLYDKNIVSGKTATEFYPEDFVTRAEFTKMLVVAMNMEGSTQTAKFTDVSQGDWYYSFVNMAVANGIIKGLSENTFAPELSISRQDASVMINRILKLEKTTEELFADDESIADYAKQSVYALKENGIIKGYEGSFNPVNNLTRAEAAVLINNMLNIVD